MLVDFRVIFSGLGALKVAGIMIVMAILTKFMAAWLTQKSFRLSKDERQMIFGLSSARVGATLAVVLVGYNIIIGETPTGDPVRLLNEDVLNGTVLMILLTCTVSSFLVEKTSQKLALQEENVSATSDETEKILNANYVNATAVLIRSIKLPEQIRISIESKLQQEQEALAYRYRLDKEKSEAERKRIAAEGEAAANNIVNNSLSDKLLKMRGIEATLELSKSPNTKVIVIGSGKDGLPLILGNN